MNRFTKICLTVLMFLMAGSATSMGWKLYGPEKKQDVSPDGSIEFRLSDDGAATADKYIRAYCRNLAELSKRTAERIRSTSDGSMDIAKDWAASSETARKEASKGVDARVSAMIEAGTSREDCAKFQDEVTAAFERLGK